MKTNDTHQTQKTKIGAWLPTLVGLALLTASAASARADDNRAPVVPDAIAVGTTNKVHFHGYAEGVQIYTWNGTDWGIGGNHLTTSDAKALVAGKPKG